MNKFKLFLEENVAVINSELEKLFVRLKKKPSIEQVGQDDFLSFISDDLQRLEEFTLRGGKRVRAVLVLLAYKLFSGKDEIPEDLVQLAVITELNHAFLLIHDDIMDESSKRREKLTLHKVYENLAKDRGIGNFQMYGISKALVMGDTLNFISSEQIFNTKFDDKLKLKLIQKLQNVLLTTCYGQILDYELNYKEIVSKEEIFSIARLKTSVYSIQAPLELGFLVSGGAEKDLSVIKKYSEFLGVAYQLQDDLLDYKMDESSGKEAFKDIKEGKITFIVFNALNIIKGENLDFVHACLGNKGLKLEEGKKVVELFEASGVFRKNQDEIDRLIFGAIDIIEKSEFNEMQKKYFVDFANFIMKRKY